MANKLTMTEDMLVRMEQAVVLGSDLKTAAAAMGISGETLRAWRRRGESAVIEYPDTDTAPLEENPYIVLHKRYERARSQLQQAALGNIHKAMSGGDWKASAWMLERRFPETYGRNALEIDVESGAQGVVVKVIKGIDVSAV